MIFILHTQIHTNSCGPLSHIWCMRFKAKHHYFKYLAKVLGNFKNIAKTLTSSPVANPSAYLVDTVESGPGKFDMYMYALITIIILQAGRLASLAPCYIQVSYLCMSNTLFVVITQ